MEILNFSINILASREMVWKVLWDKNSYEEWTSVFSPGSTIETDYSEGSVVRFLNKNGDGLYSKIERNIEYEAMCFNHLGEIKGGEIILFDTHTPAFADSRECYFLKEVNGITELNIELHTPKEYSEYFSMVFPKSMDVIKYLSEDLNPQLLKVKAALQIQNSINEVFDAIVNPDIMANYFISYGSGRMEADTHVIWRFPEFEGEAPIYVKKIIDNKLIAFSWNAPDGGKLLVEITLESLSDDSTLVRVVEKYMENNKAGITWLVSNTEGWANFLACMKAWLEFGIHLRKGAFDFMRSK